MSIIRLIWFSFQFQICHWIPIKECCGVFGGYCSPLILHTFVQNRQNHFASSGWSSISRMSAGTLSLGKRICLACTQLWKSRTHFSVSATVFLGTKPRHMSSKSSSRSKLNRLLVGGMLSLPLPDAAHLEAFTMIVGTKIGSNSYAWIPNARAFSWTIFFQ